jgi:hypothetical protein
VLRTNHRNLLKLVIKHTIRKIKLIEKEIDFSLVVKVNIDNAFTAITIDKEPMAISLFKNVMYKLERVLLSLKTGSEKIIY